MPVAKKPILLKIAPDLTHGQLKDIIEIVALTKIDGVIATETANHVISRCAIQRVVSRRANYGARASRRGVRKCCPEWGNRHQHSCEEKN